MALLVARLLLVFLLLLGARVMAQEVYVWVDGDGNPAYGDTPPPGAEARPIPIRYRRTDRQAIQDQLQRQSDLDEAARLRRSQEAEMESNDEDIRLETARQAEENCRLARETLTRYETAQRLYRPMPDGERQFLSDQELDAERAAARRAVREWCGG